MPTVAHGRTWSITTADVFELSGKTGVGLTRADAPIIRRTSMGQTTPTAVTNNSGSDAESEVTSLFVLQPTELSGTPPFVPNAETIAAIKEARAGKLKRFESVEALMADLNSED